MLNDIDDEDKIDQEEHQRIKLKLHGQPYLWKDVYYCIFNNANDFPETISFLCRIKVMVGEGGVVYATNPTKHTYRERYFDDTKRLDYCYRIARHKILLRKGLSLGFQGRILNDAKWS